MRVTSCWHCLTFSIMKLFLLQDKNLVFFSKSIRVYLKSFPNMVNAIWYTAFLVTMYCMNQATQNTDLSICIQKWYGYIINDWVILSADSSGNCTLFGILVYCKMTYLPHRVVVRVKMLKVLTTLNMLINISTSCV